MITQDLLRAIRNELPMKLTVTRLGRLGRHGPISKHSDGYFRFQCPHCGELRATVNPKNNLAHCFSCGENINNIDLMMIQGLDFLPAVTILKGWLEQYRRDLGQGASPVDSDSLQPS
jgi:DNA primase